MLCDDRMQVTGVIDFGELTVHGDYLFDIATGWIFIDMYDEVVNYPLKKLVWERIASRLTND